jgi:predicted DNA-binding transcriptional regulator AlpA
VSLRHPQNMDITMSRTDSSARAASAKKAAARKTNAEDVAQPVRLLDKREILAITGVTYPTIWKMMRDGSFPRGRVVGGKSKWRSDEVDEWLEGLPIRRLKGDEVAPFTSNKTGDSKVSP